MSGELQFKSEELQLDNGELLGSSELPPLQPTRCGSTTTGGEAFDKAGVDLTGWLQKAGHFNKDFKRRFFILRGSKLAYYEDRAAANRGKSKGEVTVRKVRHLQDGEGVDLSLMKRPLAFYFDTTERKPFIVYADTMREKLAWLRALLGAVSGGGSTPASGLVSAVEDLYRDQVSAAETGDEAGVVSSASAEERTAWVRIAKGAQLIRAQLHSEARTQFEEALQHAGYGDKASEAEAGNVTDTACLAALYELGKLLCQTGEYAAALQQFEEAMRFAPPYVHLQIRLQATPPRWALSAVTSVTSVTSTSRSGCRRRPPMGALPSGVVRSYHS